MVGRVLFLLRLLNLSRGSPIVVKTRFAEIESLSRKFKSWLQFLTNQTSANWLPMLNWLLYPVLLRQTEACSKRRYCQYFNLEFHPYYMYTYIRK
jgi:hypothetical protein